MRLLILVFMSLYSAHHVMAKEIDYKSYQSQQKYEEALEVAQKCFGTQNYPVLFKYLMPYADDKHPLALAYLGDAFRLTSEYDKALKYYEQAGDFGRALVGLGDLYMHGQGVKKDIAMAAMYYEKAAVKKDRRAINIIGTLYSEGIHYQRDDSKAYKYWYKSQKLGYEPALRNICTYSSQELWDRSIAEQCGRNSFLNYNTADYARKTIGHKFGIK